MDKNYYYAVLGIDSSATQDQIKKAYKKLAQMYHPDKNPGSKTAKEAFIAAKEAYGVLSDPVKREQYDKYGHLGVDLNIDIDRDALATLRESFMNFVDQCSDIDHVDIIKQFKKRADGIIKNNKSSIKQINKSIAKIEKVKNKIKRKSGGENLFTLAFDNKLDTLNRNLFNCEMAIKVTQRVIELLDDYEYAFTAVLTNDEDLLFSRATTSTWVNPFT